MAAKKRVPTSAKILFSVAALSLLALLVIMLTIGSAITRVKDISPAPNMLVANNVNTIDATGDYPYVDWDYWKGVNSDVVAWVMIPGTAINTPIVQAHANDPEYYLRHDIYGNWSYFGCPYLDATTESGELESLELLIYGHNTGIEGLVFYDLQYFANYDYAAEHSLILFMTPEKNMVLRIEATDIINAANVLKVSEHADKEALQRRYLSLYENSRVKLSEPEDTKQLFTFVTCSYFITNNERTVVYAVENTQE